MDYKALCYCILYHLARKGGLTCALWIAHGLLAMVNGEPSFMCYIIDSWSQVEFGGELHSEDTRVAPTYQNLWINIWPVPCPLISILPTYSRASNQTMTLLKHCTPALVCEQWYNTKRKRKSLLRRGIRFDEIGCVLLSHGLSGVVFLSARSSG